MVLQGVRLPGPARRPERVVVMTSVNAGMALLAWNLGPLALIGDDDEAA